MILNIWIIGAVISAIMFFAWYIGVPCKQTESDENTDKDDLSKSGKISTQIKAMLIIGLVILFCLAWIALSWATAATMVCDGDFRKDTIEGFRIIGRTVQRGLSQMINDKN
jgi:preprotein translocase subunit SecY